MNSSRLQSLRGGLIVSCQAGAGEPLDFPEMMAAFARAAVNGGAAGIRAERPENIRAIRAAVGVPVIGIYKKVYPDAPVFITPTLAEARAVAESGAEIIALDATLRPRPNGEKLEDIVRYLRTHSRALLMADVATLEEGRRAAQLGFELIGTTLSGYTEATAHTAADDLPDFALLEALCRELGERAAIIAEGRFSTPALVVEALQRGAFACVTGTAITRPTVMTRGFTAAIARRQRIAQQAAIGVDLGGTRGAVARISGSGEMRGQQTFGIAWGACMETVVAQAEGAIRERLAAAKEPVAAVGMAVGGRVDPLSGKVTGGVPLAEDFLNYPIAGRLSQVLQLPVWLENDANAAAYAEYRLGGHGAPRRMVVLTIGTGIGGGIIVDGELYRGQGYAGEFGQIRIDPGGRPGRRGVRGCLESYVSRELLAREIGEAFARGEIDAAVPEALNTEALIRLIRSGDETVQEIFQRQMAFLALGLETITYTLDPELIVIGGALSQLGETLLNSLRSYFDLPVALKTATLGNAAGLTGAALLALERLP